MKNNFLLRFDRIIEIKISGKNIHYYIKRVILKNKINILKLTYLSPKEVLVILKYDDYLKLIKYKSIYEIKIVKKYGKLKFISDFKKNLILLLCILFGIGLIYFLSNFIFSIDVIYNNKEIRELIYDELEKYGISKYKFKKKYDELEEIEDNILKNNKDKLEWIEIIDSGTKYIVRLEERKLNDDEEVFQYQSIIASKNCILYEIDAISGEKVKKVNDYVKKGETVISGYITLPDGSTSMTMAKGRVLGEVWYTIDIYYPYTYYEESLTGKNKKVFVINFLNHRISLFNFNKYHSFNSKSKIIFENNILNINLSLENQYEVNIISNIYTYDEAIDTAIKVGEDKLLKDNSNIIEIKDEDILESKDNGNGVYVKLFIKAIEDVSSIEKIEENINNSDNNLE